MMGGRSKERKIQTTTNTPQSLVGDDNDNDNDNVELDPKKPRR